MKRIFLVGAPRSGTTILQSLLAAHPEIISFPESKFFHYLLYEEFATKLPSRLSTFFKDEINRPELFNDFDDSQTQENKASWFVSILDSLAVEETQNIWLEKTPEHLYFIEDIQRLVPDAKFIHILRNGMDTIASMYEATRNFSELWGGVWDLEHCIERWEYAMLTSHKYVNNSNHILVKYEELIDNKSAVLTDICNFIEIEYDSAMLINYKAKAASLSLNLPWHQGIARDIQSTKIHKYHQIFNRNQIQSILVAINWVNPQVAYKFKVEVTQPILDIQIPQIYDRTYCTIQLDGVELGIIELPVCDGIVAGVVLADAIASEFAWPILDRFFRQNPENPHFGWTLFLQSIWNRPNWLEAYFYNPETADESFTINLDRDLIAVEVSAELPNIKVELSEIDVLIAVGGVAIGIITVAVDNNFVSAQKVRSAITQNSGFELCIAAVREALVGKSLHGEMSLRSRLTDAAQKITNAPNWLNAEGSGGIYPPHAVMFGRREGAIDTSVSRRAALPAAAIRELTAAATIAGEPITQIPLENELPKQVFYAPEIIWRKSPHREISQSFQPKFYDNNTVTENLPILAYNHICTEIFEQHLQYLKDSGYYSVSWQDWQNAKLAKIPLPGKAVLLTFDGGYLDFFNHAFPLLKRFDFTATVFLVAESIGKTNSWEKADSEQVQLMGWREIRQLRDAGIEFGSMSATYQPLTGLSPTEIVREGSKSRAILERGLGKPVKCFAYPYGSVDKMVEKLVCAIGYTYGVSYESKFSNFEDSLLSLPRMQVTTENALQLGL